MQRPHSPWPTIGKLVAALVAAGVLTAGLLLPYVGGLGLAARHEATKFLDTACNLQETPPPQKTTLYARDGKTVIATLFSQDRVPVSLDQVPDILQKALVATEDRRFYIHHGVDMRGLLRSAVSTSGGNTQGGSTLTMQYVKQLRYYQASEIADPAKQAAAQRAAIDQNISRKIEDAKCAIYLESTKHESKQTILQNYLNIAFFGENAYGIQTAAETYFNKPVQDLTLPESALLVGLLRAPTEYDPFVNPEAGKARRNEVIDNLAAVGDISRSEAARYKATPVRLGTAGPPVVREGCGNAVTTIKNVGFFCDYAVNWLKNVQGISDTELKTGGLTIVTTLDANLQNSVQQQLSAAMPATSPMTAVLPAVDPRTGDVLAMATSKHYGVPTSKTDRTHTQLPVFTDYTAQGASTYKLFPLLTALSTGVPENWPLQTADGYRPTNCLTDAPVKNADSTSFYSANETLASATAKSSNTFYVGLADQLLGCDLQPVIDMAQRLGMKSFDQPSGEGNLTVAQTIINSQRPAELVLGAVGTSPLELAGAYAAVADEGRYNAPAPVLSITDEAGHAVPVKRTPGTQVVQPQVAQQAVDVLRGDTVGFGTSAQQFAQYWYPINPSPVAGKTGTGVARDESKNAALWFVGMTPDLVAASAVINTDQPNAPAAGLPGLSDPGTQAFGNYASRLWALSLGPALKDQRWEWPSPDQVDGGVPVPPVVGMDLQTARTTLAAAGFQMVQLGAADQLLCASTQPLGTVAYAGPQIATKGSVITVCASSGVGQTVYVPPPPRPVPPPATRPTTTPTTSPKPSPPPPSSAPPSHGRGH